jgi:segregation and condensation protein A
VSFDDDDERRVSEADDSDAALDEALRDDQDLLTAAERQGNDPGIALLVEMARRGEIDPWNIDIIDVTDKYLAALARRSADGGRLAPADLARSAKCIFYAAALHNMKARALAERHARALLAATETVDLDAEGMAELARRGLRPGDLPLLYPDDGRGILAPRERRPRERALTLLDLIAALRSLDERVATREALLAEMPVWDAATAFDECIGGSHQDDVEQDKADLRAELSLALLSSPGSCVEDRALQKGRFRSRAQVFLALLSLANDEEVDLDQESIYGRLFVRIGARFGRPLPKLEAAEPAAVAAAEED